MLYHVYVGCNLIESFEDLHDALDCANNLRQQGFSKSVHIESEVV